MNNTLIRITGAAAFVTASLLSQVAAAAPNILGLYTGSFTGTEFNCSPPPSGPFADSFVFTLTINDQQGNNFTGTGTTNDNDNVSVSGDVIDPGEVSASFTFTSSDGGTGSGSMSGTLSGDTLTLNISGSDTSGPGQLCQFEYTGTMTRVTTSSTDPTLAPSTNITSEAGLRSSIRLFSQSLTQRFNVFRSGVSSGASAVGNGFMLQGNGMNAGSNTMPYPFGVWGSFSYTDSKDDSAARTFDSDRSQFLGGVDLSPWEDVLMGVAVGYESADVDTPVNGGNQDIDGLTVAPYVAMLLGDTLSADASFGFSNIDIKQSRVLAGTTLGSKVDSTRTFFAANLNASRSFGDLLLTGNVGYLYARDRHDAYTETGGTLSVANRARTFKLGQVRVGAEASYLFDEFEPFASVAYEYDYTVTSSVGQRTDDDGGVVGVGVRYFGTRNGVSGSVDYQAVVGRSNLDEGTIGVNLRLDF